MPALPEFIGYNETGATPHDAPDTLIIIFARIAQAFVSAICLLSVFFFLIKVGIHLAKGCSEMGACAHWNARRQVAEEVASAYKPSVRSMHEL
ncbi:hypothetical protein IG631_14171 [Alternaria alternata]|nr:hypothetical protein IG631_14171 [Alternaria alternata]